MSLKQIDFRELKPAEIETILESFFQGGWILSLGRSRTSAAEPSSDHDEIAIGWGLTDAATGKELPDLWSSEPAVDGCSLYAPDFYLENPKPWLQCRQWAIVTRSDLARWLSSFSSAPSQNSEWQLPAYETFATRFQTIREGFESRGLQKGVPVVFSTREGQFEVADRVRSLKNLLTLPAHLYLHGIWSGKSGMLGATPEILFTSNATGIETMALAGTKGKSQSPLAGEELMRDPKERYEHQLVVEDITKQLSKIGDVILGDTHAFELPTLFHLKTRIQLRFPAHLQTKPSFQDLVQLLHPTPALGVSPRELRFTEMRLWDDASMRERYGAPFGIAIGERMHCLVAIRNIQWHAFGQKLGTGCGVVGESQVDREWSELAVKRDSVRKMLSV